MKFDMHVVVISTMLMSALMFLLLPLYSDFGKPNVFETTVAIVVSVMTAFVLGKEFGERKHG